VVNGIANGAVIVVNGEARTVTGVSDNASGISTITVGVGFSTAPSAGVLVAEQKVITVTTLSGTITSSGSSIVITKHLTVTSQADNTKTITSSDITDTYVSGLVTLTKYVRNVTNAITGSTSVAYGGNTYYASNVTAKPGEVLEYLLVATNSGSGSVSASTVTDALPTTYVSLKTLAYNSGAADFTYFNESGTASYLTAAADTDAATYAAPNLTIYVGTGATSSAGGTIAAGATVRALYQVTVNL
jgi:hypothetical protein